MHAFTHAAATWALPGIIAASALGALLMCLLVLRYGFPPAEGAPGANGRFLASRLGHAVAGTCFSVSAMLAVVALSQPPRAAAPAPAPVVADTSALQAEVEGLRRQLATLEGRLGQSETRLGAAESRLTAGEGRGDASASRVDRLETRLRASEVSLRQVNADTDRALAAVKQLSARPATPPAPVRRPAPALTPSAAPPPSAAVVPPPSAPPPLDAALRPSPQAARPPAPPREALSQDAAASPGRAEPADRPRPLVDKLRDDWEEIKRDSKTAGDELGKAFRRFRDMLKPD